MCIRDSLSNDPEFGQHGLVSILAVFQHVLNRYEIVTGNDPFMLVVIMTDRPFAAVLDGLMGQHILGEGLSGIHIATVPVSYTHLGDDAELPNDDSQIEEA